MYEHRICCLFSEYEREPANGEPYEHAGCPTYPATVVASTKYVTVEIDGEQRSADELFVGELQLQSGHKRLTERLQRAGYKVCGSPVDAGWLQCWEKAPEMAEHHQHHRARWVQF